MNLFWGKNDNLPHIIMTNDLEWDPTIMDGLNEYVFNYNNDNKKQEEWLFQ